MEFEIREIISQENSAYKGFLAVGLREDEDNFRISPEDDAKSPFPTRDREDSFTLGAYAGKTLCGVVSFARDGLDREKLRHKGTLFRMFVGAEYRGQGIARALIRAVVERAARLESLEQINLTVLAGNDKARLLYASEGFKVFGYEERAIKWRGKYHDEYQMTRRMAST